MELLYQIIDYISFVTPIILLIGVFSYIYVKNKTNTNRLILYLFLFGLIIDILSRIFAKIYNNNLIFINIYTIIDLIILYLIIKENSTNFKKYYHLIFSLVVLFNLYEFTSINFSNPIEYQSYSKSLNSIFLLFLSLIQIIKAINLDLTNNKKYSILIFLCIYLTFSAFLNIPINFLINYSNYTIFIIWLINSININLFYSYLIYYIWKSGKTQK